MSKTLNDAAITDMPAFVALRNGDLGLVFIYPDTRKIHWAVKDVDQQRFHDQGAIGNGAIAAAGMAATAINFNGTPYVFYQGANLGLCWAKQGAEKQWTDNGIMRNASTTFYTTSTVSPIVYGGQIMLAYRSREGTLKGVSSADGQNWVDLGPIDVR